MHSEHSSRMPNMTKPPTVAVIGCGPSGMFFLHTVAIRRARLEAEGDAEGLAALPVVTCFERSSGPGGVWRSDRFEGERDGGASNMYEALWTNGPKESMEFFDYTYLEHFGRAMPTFLPRGLVLEYILARCTKNNPDFFDEVKFNTSVDSVKYDEESEKFILDASDGSKTSFDFCIWAAGDNGKPCIPPSIANMLREGGYKGTTMHSAQTDENFDAHVRGKNVVIVGGEASAEDLALQAIKLGVERIDIVTRSAEGMASDTSSWPMGKVHVNENCLPTGVTEDGRGIVCSMVEYNYEEEEYVTIPGRQITLDNVDTVIYATGYGGNLNMLEESLRPDFDACFEDGDVPLASWKMSENVLTEDLGDVAPCEEIWPDPGFARPDMYRGRLISNPSMFFLWEEHHVPLFNLDILAWLVLAQITGDLPLPPPEEMHRFNTETLFECMNDPFWRYNSDDHYSEKWRKFIGDDHWAADYMSVGMIIMHRNYHHLAYRLLARDALDAGYPLDFGTYEALNEKGDALVEIELRNEYVRLEMDESSPDAEWRTFRDCDTSGLRSVMTGTEAAPLKGRWLELDSCEEDDIVGDTAADGEVSVLWEEDTEAEEKKESDDKIPVTKVPGSPTSVCCLEESDDKITVTNVTDSSISLCSLEESDDEITVTKVPGSPISLCCVDD